MLPIFIVSGIIATIIFLVSYSDYYGTTEDIPKIKFSTFRTFYEINPSRWSLSSHTVKCKIPRKDIKDNNLYGGLFYIEECFAFNYIDTFRYNRWNKKLNNYNTYQSNVKATARMLEAVKQDIANLESQAQREQSEAIEILRSITNAKS